MRFEQFLTESTGIEAFNKHFSGKDFITKMKKDSPLYDLNGKKTDDMIEGGEEVHITIASTFFKGGRISVLYNDETIYVTLNDIVKPGKGGEQLSIQATKLLQSAPGRIVTIGEKVIKSKVFYNAPDLAVTVQNGIQLIKTIPEDLKLILTQYLQSGIYNKIDWQGYDNKPYMKEIAKYLGEIAIGLITLNNESGIKGDNPFKGKKIKEFIMPVDSSFPGVDSMFKTHDGTIIPISSKSGKGAPSSFHTNVMPVLSNNKDIKVTSKLLNYMINIYKSKDLKNLDFIYHVGIGLMKPYLKGSIGQSILKSPYSIYTNIMHGNIGENEEYLINVIKSNRNKWADASHIDDLPNSMTYWLSKNIAELINNDKSAIETITKALSYKNFYQANLNLPKFLSGNVEFDITHSGGGKVKMTHGKGSFHSVKSEQGRLSYIITSS